MYQNGGNVYFDYIPFFALETNTLEGTIENSYSTA